MIVLKKNIFEATYKKKTGSKLVLTMWLLLILAGCMGNLTPTPSGLGGVATVAATSTAETEIYLPVVTRSPVFTTVRPVELQDGYIPNPGMGWQNTRYDTQRFPATIQYARFNWDELNPAENVYNWEPIETLRQEAVAAGESYHFRARNMQPPPWGPGHVLPDWVIDKGATLANTPRGKEPVYHNCQFLAAQGDFVEALRRKYDGDPALAYLDIGAYGNFGEWDTEQYDEAVGSLDWHARRRLADMYLGGEGTRPCKQADGKVVDVSYNYAGFEDTQLLMPYTPWRKETVFYVMENRSDVGIRHDALGSSFHQQQYREEIGDLVKQIWQDVPIVFEFYPEARSVPELISAKLFAQEMHASIVHQNFSGRDALVKDILDVIGYRLVLQEITYVSELPIDEPLIIKMAWKNTNYAPSYEAYPLMVALVNNQGTVVWEDRIDTDVRSWLPLATISTDDEFMLPENLPVGLYDLRIAFVDPDSGQPTLDLAIKGKDSNGRYQIGQVQIKNER